MTLNHSKTNHMRKLNPYMLWYSMLLLGVALFIAYLIIHFSQVRAYMHQYNLGGYMVIMWFVLVGVKECMIVRKRIRREVKHWGKRHGAHAGSAHANR